MALPAEPRQKMINIMYLVLTALLALNVSVQILNAFVAVNNGLVLTNKNFDLKNQSTMALFEKALANDRKKTKPFYDKAVIVQTESRKICSFIDTLKSVLIATTDAKTRKTADTINPIDISAKDNFDIPTHIMIRDDLDEDGSKGQAHEMKRKLADFRHLVMAMCDPKDTAFLNIGLKTGDNKYSKEWEKKVTWEVDNFYERPLVAEIVLLSKEQNDVKNVEATMEQYLLSSVSSNDFKVSGFEPEMIPSSNYVLLGDSFKAKLFVSAVSKTQQPTIYVGDVDTITGKIIKGGHVDSVRVREGTGYYSVKTDHEGTVKYAGSINVKAPDGTIKSYAFHSSYLVAKPAVVISPTEMNVFYIGVDNPVEISAPGFSAEDLRPSFQGPGSIAQKGHGQYVVRVTSGAGTKCHIGVSAKKLDGSGSQNFPPQEFRIKAVPDPICYVLNKKGNIRVPKVQLQLAETVQARMENFDFNLPYTVTAFTMIVSVNGVNKNFTASGEKFTTEMHGIMKVLPVGSTIVIADVHCSSAAGPKVIPGVTLSIN
jgi:gliding motility-associated protein GldM